MANHMHIRAKYTDQNGETVYAEDTKSVPANLGMKLIRRGDWAKVDDFEAEGSVYAETNWTKGGPPKRAVRSKAARSAARAEAQVKE